SVVLADEFSGGITFYTVFRGIVHLPGIPILFAELGEEPGGTRVPIAVAAVVAMVEVCPEVGILFGNGDLLDLPGQVDGGYPAVGQGVIYDLVFQDLHLSIFPNGLFCRSEERRVGKECRFRWSPDDRK